MAHKNVQLILLLLGHITRFCKKLELRRSCNEVTMCVCILFIIVFQYSIISLKDDSIQENRPNYFFCSRNAKLFLGLQWYYILTLYWLELYSCMCTFQYSINGLTYDLIYQNSLNFFFCSLNAKLFLFHGSCCSIFRTAHFQAPRGNIRCLLRVI